VDAGRRLDELCDRIDCIDEWAKANAPLEPDELATAELMVKCQVARGIMRGDFDDICEISGVDRDRLIDAIFDKRTPSDPPSRA
jgi:hypothetical protein